MQVLGSTIANAAHFTDSQEKGKEIKHVAKVWQDQCLTYEQGLEKVAAEQAQIQDIRSPLSHWEPTVTNEGKFALLHKPSGQSFVPTEKATRDMAVLGFTSEWFLADMQSDKKMNASEDAAIRFRRDRQDAEVLVSVLNATLFHPKRVEQDKTRLFRTWKNGTLRAVLSEQYTILNNMWYLETLKELIPGGLLSHWRGDADTVFGNILIPDTIREESDSHYGGMLSVGNSEIGLRRLMSLPSVFRAICMNGCIWEQEKGEAVNRVHRGEIDYDGLKLEIAKNLQAQIPLLSDGINRVLGCRLYKMGDVATVNVIAQLFIDFKLPKSQATKFLANYNVEAGILGSEVRTAFGLQSALTRLGQELDNDTWVKYDQIAGKIASLTPDRWDGMLKRAKTLDKNDLEKSLGDISHLMG